MPPSMLMVLATLLFATMGVCVKLASELYAASEIVMYRGLVGMTCMALLTRRQGVSLKTRLPGMHLWRSICGVAALSLWFYAIGKLPLATAMTLNYMSSVWMALFLLGGAVLMGAQRLDWRLMAAVLLGFVGVALILRPTLEHQQLWYGLAGLVSGMLSAMAYLQVTALGRAGEPELRVVFYFSMGGAAAGALITAATVGGLQPHTLKGAALLLAVGLLATAAQVLMTRAYTVGRVLLHLRHAALPRPADAAGHRGHAAHHRGRPGRDAAARAGRAAAQGQPIHAQRILTMHTTLISPAQLRGLPDPLILDCRFELADTEAGARAYAAGHIPGAHYLHLDRDLAGAKSGTNGRHPLPERAAFAALLRRLGLRAGRQVVCYDTQGGQYAARAWWMLRWLGHAEVAVLDGAWDGELTTDIPTATPTEWQPGAPLVGHIDAATLLQKLGRVRLIDARAPERFRGEVEPLDKLAGHIPGASNRLFKDNLLPDRDGGGRFKPAAQLREEFAALLAPYAAADVVHQCGSGVTACHNLLAMAHAGLGDGLLYPGSWSEWSADPAKPIAKA